MDPDTQKTIEKNQMNPAAWMHRKTGTSRNFSFLVLCRNRRIAANAPNGPRAALQRSVPSGILPASAFALFLSDAKSRNAMPLKRTMAIPRYPESTGSDSEISPCQRRIVLLLPFYSRSTWWRVISVSALQRRSTGSFRWLSAGCRTPRCTLSGASVPAPRLRRCT